MRHEGVSALGPSAQEPARGLGRFLACGAQTSPSVSVLNQRRGPTGCRGQLTSPLKVGEGPAATPAAPLVPGGGSLAVCPSAPKSFYRSPLLLHRSEAFAGSSLVSAWALNFRCSSEQTSSCHVELGCWRRWMAGW